MDISNDLDLLAARTACDSSLLPRFLAESATLRLRLARRHTCYCREADDLAQEVALIVVSAIATFDPERGRCAGWLAALTRHTAARLHRRCRPCDPLLGTSTDAADRSFADPSRRLLLRQLDDWLAQSADDDSALVRRYLLGWRASELASRHGISAACARQRVSRLLRRLREQHLPDSDR